MRKVLSAAFVFLGSILLIGRSSKEKDLRLSAITHTLERFSITPIYTERGRIEILFQFKIYNGNFKDLIINEILGDVTYRGEFFTSFPSNLPLYTIVGKEENIFDVKFILNVNDRATPVIVKNTWRNGVFAGSVIVEGTFKTDIGEIDFKEVIEIT